MTAERGEEKETEVIAEKSRAVAYAFLALSAAGVFICFAGALMFIKFAGVQNTAIFALKITLTAFGVAMAIIFGALFIVQLYKQFTLIALKDGKISFPDGTFCMPHEISKIYVEGKTITVELPQRKVVIERVANCEKAQKKLAMLAGKHVDIN